MFILTKYTGDMEELGVIGASRYFTMCYHNAEIEINALQMKHSVIGIPTGKTCVSQNTLFYKNADNTIHTVWVISEIPTLEAK